MSKQMQMILEKSEGKSFWQNARRVVRGKRDTGIEKKLSRYFA